MKFKPLIVLAIIFAMLLSSCTTVEVSPPPESYSEAPNLYDPTYIILPAGVDIPVLDDGEYVVVNLKSDTSYVQESKYSALEQKYLVLLGNQAKE